jgi:predicted small lipoprotein YifL
MWHEPASSGCIPSNRHGGYTARMNRRLALTSAVFVIVLPLALSGCGNKGPLVLPGAPAETTVPAETSAPATAPETTVPTPEPAPETTAPAPPASGTPAR